MTNEQMQFKHIMRIYNMNPTNIEKLEKKIKKKIFLEDGSPNLDALSHFIDFIFVFKEFEPNNFFAKSRHQIPFRRCNENDFKNLRTKGVAKHYLVNICPAVELLKEDEVILEYSANGEI